MIKLKKKLPVLLMTAVITPALVIGILGIYLVSQQKNARLLNVKKEFTNRLIHIRGSIETRVRQLVEKVFQPIDKNSLNIDDPETLPDYAKSIVLNNPVVKYPFFITSRQTFLFPFSKKTGFPSVKSSPLEGKILKKKVKELYIKAFNLEYKKRNFIDAVKRYLECLEENPASALKPFIYNAIARCYFKLNQLPQAVTYYQKTIDLYTDPKPWQKDKLLYFTALRQLAVSYRQLESEENALKYYLLLYEKILNHDYNTRGKSSFAFFKNEALDYLNRRAGKDKQNIETDRFSKAKAMDRLQEVSQLDISLRWLYFDTDREEKTGEAGADKEESRFLKLRELYETNDEKTRFYQALKRTGEWAAGESNGIKINRLKLPVSHRTCDIAFKPVLTDHPQFETVFFGFMLSFDFIKREIISRAAGEALADPSVFVDVSDRGKPGLLSVSFQSLFQGKSLTLYAHRDNYFETIVRRDIRLYYGLLFALILALALGIILFYKYLTREAELVRLKAEFVDSTSHTLKTPLTRISLLAENVKQGWVTEESQKEEFFTTIISETARMSEMIDNMLNFSRIEAGKQQYEPEKVYLQEIAASMINRYSTYIEKMGFELAIEIDDHLPALWLDPKAVKLIIGNLLHNAVKYSLDKKCIKIRVYRENKGVVLAIEDRGIGIPKKDIPYLFKKFSRVPDTRIKAIEGSGLGLFLVRHAVDAHNGQIEVESTPGKGSIFRVFFPVNDGGS